MDDNIAYDTLAGQLADAGFVPTLAELHGGLCGVMCVGGIEASGSWLTQYLDEQPEHGPVVEEALRSLENDAWRSLVAEDMSFEPLLPDETASLEEQVRALASWCQGFLSGLAFGGWSSHDGTPEAREAAAEITKDFGEISRAVLAPGDSEEVDPGFALAELKEYVRVSAQLMFEHFGSRSRTASGATLH